MMTKIALIVGASGVVGGAMAELLVAEDLTIALGNNVLNLGVSGHLVAKGSN